MGRAVPSEPSVQMGGAHTGCPLRPDPTPAAVRRYGRQRSARPKFSAGSEPPAVPSRLQADPTPARNRPRRGRAARQHGFQNLPKIAQARPNHTHTLARPPARPPAGPPARHLPCEGALRARTRCLPFWRARDPGGSRRRPRRRSARARRRSAAPSSTRKGVCACVRVRVCARACACVFRCGRRPRVLDQAQGGRAGCKIIVLVETFYIIHFTANHFLCWAPRDVRRGLAPRAPRGAGSACSMGSLGDPGGVAGRWKNGGAAL